MRIKLSKPRIKADTKKMRMAAPPVNAQATPRQRGRAWMVRRAAWLIKFPLCRECETEGRSTIATQVDHIQPLWSGGSDDESNYQSICDQHHSAKSASEAKARAAAGIRRRWD